MKQLKASIIIILILGFISGCIFDGDDDNSGFKYPLSVDNRWEYTKHFTEDYDSLANSNGITDTTYSAVADVEIISEEVIFDSINVFNLRTRLYEDGNMFTGYAYYNNHNGQLITYGYNNPLMCTPKKNKKNFYFPFRGRKFSSIREIVELVKRGAKPKYCRSDSIIYDPVKCLDYPMLLNKIWTYRTETYDGTPWRIDKKVIDRVNIEVPAGNFFAWKIQYFNNPFGSGPNWDEDIVMYDFISNEGLVKRHIEILNQSVTDYNGNPMGLVNFTEEMVLGERVIQ